MSESAAAVKDLPRHEYLRTPCGTEVTVGRLALGDERYPITRVFVGLADEPDDDKSSWTALTATEARELARALLSQAAAAERDCQADSGSPGRVTVSHVSGDAYAIAVRGHSV